MQYRPEIDGLRALAVLPVVLFHAGIAGFSGGFVGVDVFFVISGYLICSIILHEQDKGSFTLAGFYERRARRILPALMLICLLSLVAAWFLLLPHELVDFGKSMAAVGGFASNILFWQQSNYFAPTSEFIPLLHTWSLAIEEQFYLFFPVLMILMASWFKRSKVLLFLALAIVSLLLSEWSSQAYPEANFFLLHTRAWELFAGVLCAFYLYHGFLSPNLLRQLGALLGLALLGVSVFGFDNSIPFPGINALIPVGATVLLITMAQQDTLVGKLLGVKPLVAIGLISYSAYLWHQPLFVFARMLVIDEMSVALLLGLSTLSFALAWLSWRWIEQPFRNRQWLSQKTVLYLAGFSLLLLVGIGLSLVYADGVPGRFE